MTTFLLSSRFYLRYSWFNFREQFSDLSNGLAGFILFPFLTWLLALLWSRFNSYQGHYSLSDVLQYVGLTEILFLSFLKPYALTRASGDFSLSLARPRSWLLMSFAGMWGQCLGSRLIYLGIYLVIMPLLGIDFALAARSAARILLLLPLLGVFQGLLGLTFASAQVLWTETQYFILPVSKIFLALGGVFGPLTDFGEPWRSWLLKLPPADLFFQAAHFSVKGEFYQITEETWLIRIFILCGVLFILNLFFYRHARHYHQSYGG